MTRTVTGRVEFAASRETVFDYLVDPRHRPEWQSSLARVTQVDGEPRTGQAWVDETRLGIKPAMRTTELDRPRRWRETGSWRFVTAELALAFYDRPDGGCTVAFEFAIHALGPLGSAASYAARRAVASDLGRAARILSSR